jgi:hypothetical protein
LIQIRLVTSAQVPFTLLQPKKKRILGLHNTSNGALNTPRLGIFSCAATAFWFTPDYKTRPASKPTMLGLKPPIYEITSGTHFKLQGARYMCRFSQQLTRRFSFMA